MAATKHNTTTVTCSGVKKKDKKGHTAEATTKGGGAGGKEKNYTGWWGRENRGKERKQEDAKGGAGQRASGKSLEGRRGYGKTNEHHGFHKSQTETYGRQQLKGMLLSEHMKWFAKVKENANAEVWTQSRCGKGKKSRARDWFHLVLLRLRPKQPQVVDEPSGSLSCPPRACVVLRRLSCPLESGTSGVGWLGCVVCNQVLSGPVRANKGVVGGRVVLSAMDKQRGERKKKRGRETERGAKHKRVATKRMCFGQTTHTHSHTQAHMRWAVAVAYPCL